MDGDWFQYNILKHFTIPAIRRGDFMIKDKGILIHGN